MSWRARAPCRAPGRASRAPSVACRSPPPSSYPLIIWRVRLQPSIRGVPSGIRGRYPWRPALAGPGRIATCCTSLMIHRHPEHLKTFDYIGLHRYSLRFCTDTRRPLFTITERVDLVLEQFVRAATEEGFAIVAYCFMPD